jgi:hypothetical protein
MTGSAVSCSRITSPMTHGWVGRREPGGSDRSASASLGRSLGGRLERHGSGVERMEDDRLLTATKLDRSERFGG